MRRLIITSALMLMGVCGCAEREGTIYFSGDSRVADIDDRNKVMKERQEEEKKRELQQEAFSKLQEEERLKDFATQREREEKQARLNEERQALELEQKRAQVMAQEQAQKQQEKLRLHQQHIQARRTELFNSCSTYAKDNCRVVPDTIKCEPYQQEGWCHQGSFSYACETTRQECRQTYKSACNNVRNQPMGCRILIDSDSWQLHIQIDDSVVQNTTPPENETPTETNPCVNDTDMGEFRDPYCNDGRK